MHRRDFLVQSSAAALGVALPRFDTARLVERRDLAALIDRFNRQVPLWMQELSVPGVGIAVLKDAKIAWQGSFGVRDAATRAAVDGETIFEAASMSKPAFAYVVMKLCETGVMNLDVPLTRYTPDRFLAGDDRLERITARHILSHTGGFQNWRSESSPLAIHFPPGERYMYSGEGYNYLQTVVTRLLGQPFETFMRERLLAPLGMSSSGYVWNDAFAKRMARPHDARGEPFANNRSTPEGVARYGAAGALLTTPSDYARFVIAVMDPARRGPHFLARKSVEEMLRPHVKIDGGRYPASWSLGWQIFHNDNRDYFFHGGDNDGFHCFAVASVAGRSGLVVMTNGEGGTKFLAQVITDEATQAFLSA
jgi:CubicO group peptidase (beta-lactamase class C family)